MKNTKKRILIIIVGSIFIVSIGVLSFGFLVFRFFTSNYYENTSPEKKAEMLEITLEWGRLAPIPDCKSEFDINTEGGSFSRSFRTSFILPQEDLEKWIHNSSGLLDAEIKDISTSTKRYIIKPGGGAGYAEAVIDFMNNSVKLYVSWS